MSNQEIYTIFYDLETSSKNFIGQILNYSFICVDSKFQIVAELSGDIALSRLQLPEPGALLANKVLISKHLNPSSKMLREPEALAKIRDFIDEQVKLARSSNISLIGYNSARFDLPYLRTSMIRNGINPYFKGLDYKDLLHVVRKLSVSNKKFPRLPAANDKDLLSLRLETLTQHFDLLQGQQAHSSREDVILTIEFAKLLLEKFNIDVRKYSAYEAENISGLPVIQAARPEYDLNKQDSTKTLSHLLRIDEDYRGSLWIDIEDLENEEASLEDLRPKISYYNKKNSALYIDSSPASKEKLALAQKILPKLKSINLRNYFTTSKCDIEQDIYRLDFDNLDYLSRAIWTAAEKKPNDKLSKDAKVLLTRYKLNQVDNISDKDTAFISHLKAYCSYRYGGDLLLWREPPKEEKPEAYHPSFKELCIELEKLKTESQGQDLKILEDLESYYKNSDLLRYGGLVVV